MSAPHPVKVRSEIVQRYVAGESIADLSREFKMNRSTIYNWVRIKKKKAREATPKFIDIPVAEPTSAGRYMVIICDLVSLKKLAASL